MSSEQQRAQTRFARVIARACVASGVSHVFISPGSRSTPFAYALLTEPGLRATVVVDERSAAFQALGNAKLTGRPTLLLCTSGSAGANYFPAVVEASSSLAPLLMLTADRPLELQDNGAAQTIDQLRLFGTHARAFHDLGAAEQGKACLIAAQRKIAQAVATATGPAPGAVHLNVRARKPLEPALPEPALPELPPTTKAIVMERRPVPGALSEAAEALCRAKRPLLVCGPELPFRAVPPALLARFTSNVRLGVFGELTSQQRLAVTDDSLWLAHHDLVLRSPTASAELQPDLVLMLGRPPTGGPLDRFLGLSSARRWHIADDHWPDPWNSAELLLGGSTGATLDALLAAVTRLGGPQPMSERARWLARLRELDALAAGVLREVLDESTLHELSVVRAAVDRLPAQGILWLGNSLPVREAELVVPPANRGVVVLHQRGASGIDGLVAGAVGSAAVRGQPTLLVLGDVSLLHDASSLLSAGKLRTPLAILVLDNGGGRIFEMLPVGSALPKPLLDAWLTPEDVDLAQLAAAYRVGYAAPETLAAVGAAVDAALTHPGATLIHVRLAGEDAVTTFAELGRRMEAAVAG